MLSLNLVAVTTIFLPFISTSKNGFSTIPEGFQERKDKVLQERKDKKIMIQLDSEQKPNVEKDLEQVKKLKELLE